MFSAIETSPQLKNNDILYSRSRTTFQHRIFVTASFSPKSGTLELPKNSELNNLSLIIPTPEPTLPAIQPSSLTNTHSLSSNLTTRHSHTSPPTKLQVTIVNVTYNVPSKKKYNIFEDPVFIDSGILHPVIQPVKHPSQTNTTTREFLRTHPNFKANLLSRSMTPT